MPHNLGTFPFPFTRDTFRYSNNTIPLDPPVCTEITEFYKEEIVLKRNLLAEHPERCFRALPHTLEAQWEAVDLLLQELNDVYPQHFEVEGDDNERTLYNRLTGEKETFSPDLPEPLNKIGRHVQEDLLLLTQRDGNLYLDAGQLCFPANWSLAFNIGNVFESIHFPVPGFSGSRLLEKIRKFIMRIEAGQPWVRRNWSLTVDRHLDTSLETSSSWGSKRKAITVDNAGSRIHLRVEVQKLFRLPGSNSILFSIHTHLLPVKELVENPQWLRRFHSVLTELPKEISDYKGITPFRTELIQYLEREIKTLQETRP